MHHEILVIGLGPVGLVTALGFAELGHKVVGIDINLEKIESLKQGIIPFYEPALKEVLQKHLKSGNVKFFTDASQWIPRFNVIFVCVGTPTLETGESDLSSIKRVTSEIKKHAKGYTLVVEKSTVPVLTARWLEKEFSQDPNAKIEVASNPEFLRMGTALRDFLNPDRIVIGVRSERAKKILLEIYKKIKTTFFITDIETSEIIKHASNAFLAMKVSFINMIADLCEVTGADVVDVARGLGLDKRIGSLFLQAGIGFGGPCLPKDIKAFQNIGRKLGLNFKLMESILEINELRTTKFVTHLKSLLKNNLNGKTIALLGLSFKPNTDDVREAPSIRVIRTLLEQKTNLRLHDPVAIPRMKTYFPEKPPEIKYFEDPYEAIKESDALGIITDWVEYKNLDLAKVYNLMKTPIIVDGRNILDPEKVISLGFKYRGMGRGRWLKKEY